MKSKSFSAASPKQSENEKNKKHLFFKLFFNKTKISSYDITRVFLEH